MKWDKDNELIFDAGAYIFLKCGQYIKTHDLKAYLHEKKWMYLFYILYKVVKKVTNIKQSFSLTLSLIKGSEFHRQVQTKPKLG